MCCFFYQAIVKLIIEAFFEYSFNYRIHLRISRPSFKSNWIKLCQKMSNTSKKYYIMLNKSYSGVVLPKSVEIVNLSTSFCDPRMSRIEKIFGKNCPKFNDFYASNLYINNDILGFLIKIWWNCRKKHQPGYNEPRL